MFINKITICNLFAYYGTQSVTFNKQKGKDLYCIYGANNNGKTSLMACARLLFLGTGLLDDGIIPPAIQRIAENKKSPLALLKKSENWDGVLNTNAFNEGLNDFYICFEGELNEDQFLIKRSWLNVHDSQISEHLQLKIGDEIYEDKKAQEKLNIILPPNFVEFFFFNGEKIDSLADDLRKQLREKIEEILQIKPLEIIIDQAQKHKDELRDSQITNKENASKLQARRQAKNTLQDEINDLNELIKDIKSLCEEKEFTIKQKERKLQNLGADTSKERALLIAEKNSLEANLVELKDGFKISIKNVIFDSNKNLMQSLKDEIKKLETAQQKGDIDAIKRLTPRIKEIIGDEMKMSELNKIEPKTFSKLQSVFEGIIDKLPVILEGKNLENSAIPPSIFAELKEAIIRLESSNLHELTAKIRDSKNQIKQKIEEIKAVDQDENIIQEKEDLEAQIAKLQDEKHQKEAQKEQYQKEKTEKEHQIQEIDLDIERLQGHINTERIDNKLALLESLQKAISLYKERLIATLKGELRDSILQKYKMLCAKNNRIYDLQINDEFEIKIQGLAEDMITIESQSAGYKQIIAIAIFWALSEISHSKIPLIIDSPLMRLDKGNRRRTIENYYNQGRQIIVLPTNTELGLSERSYSENITAGIYKLKRESTRTQIYPATFDEAMQEE